MQGILKKLIKKQHVSTAATVFLMFTYTFLLKRDLTCTYRQQNVECCFYIALPVFIISILILWSSRSSVAVCRYTCTFCCSNGCCTSCINNFRTCFCFLLSSSKVVRAISMGLLWVVFVLIDGDWYVCCQNDGSEEEIQLSYKKVDSRTESERMRISELKNKSRLIGGFLILVIVSVGFLMNLMVWIRCCKSSSLCDRKLQFYKLILKEEGRVLKQVLKKSACDLLNKEIQTSIQGKNWEDCFNAAKDLIKNSAKPGDEDKNSAKPGVSGEGSSVEQTAPETLHLQLLRTTSWNAQQEEQRSPEERVEKEEREELSV